VPEQARTAGRRSVGETFGGWLERHAQTLVASLGRLARQPLGTLLTIGVIGVALALPACLHLFVTNARALSGGWESTLDFTVYLDTGVPETAARQLAARIGARPDVEAARLVTAEEGLREFREWSGLGAALDALGENPLPAAIVVRPRVGAAGGVLDQRAGDAVFGPAGGEAPDPAAGAEATTGTAPGAVAAASPVAPGTASPRDAYAAVTALAAELREIRGVAEVQLDTDWIRRLEAVLAALNRAVTIAAVVLAVAVLMIVGNTIRLDIDGRRAEIEVTKLVGATDAFVRRPFLYGGLWYGLGGGLLAWLMVLLIGAALDGPVARLAQAYGSAFRLDGLGAEAAAWLVLGGALLGWLGAWLSATRHLRAVEPGTEPG
jgi:cell division transport system permease protein